MKELFSNIRLTYLIIPKNYRSKVLISTLLTFINGFLDLFSLAAIVSVVIIFLEPGPQSNLSTMLNEVGLFISETNIPFILIAIAILFIIKNLLSTWINYYKTKVAFDISTRLSQVSLEDFYKLSYLDFADLNSTKVIQKVKVVPHDFVNYILLPSITLFSEVVIGLLIIIGLALVNPIICIMLGITMTPTLLVWRWYKKKHLNKLNDDFKEKYPESLKLLLQGVDSYIDVRVYGKQSYFVNKFMALKKEMNQNYVFMKTSSIIPQKSLEVIVVTGIVSIFLYATLVQSELQLVPMLTLFAAGFYRLYPSVNNTLTALNNISSYRYTLEELYEKTNEHKALPSQAVTFTEKISVKNICFGYAGVPLFENLNLSIKKGQCIAISGVSGTGKTTLVKLLLGLLQPNKGSIQVDDVELKGIHMNSWFSKFAYLQQRPVVLDASIEENIAFGDLNIDRRRLQEAIDQSNLGTFINSLPDKLQTEIGEHGVKISGGQAQRIAVARALYRKADVLICDEISNNLDQANINDLKEIVRLLNSAGKTILLIDHHESLLDLAHTIWEVTNGSVIVQHNNSIYA